MPKDLTYNTDAMSKILSGSEKLSRTVSVTMGPQGKNVILGKFVGAPVLTKDGVSVAREIVLEDPVEDLACQLIKEAAGRTAALAGDGTTTATVLADEILINGSSLLSAGCSPLSLRRGLELGVSMIVDELNKMSVSVESFEDLKNIATISANNDESLGDSIARAFHSVGLDGTVVAQASPGVTNSVKFVDGVEISSGFVNDGFLTEDGQSEVQLTDCRVLILDEDLSNISLCVKLLNDLSDSNSPVAIFAQDFGQEVLRTLVTNNRLGRLKSVAVKIPVFGSAQKEWLDCLAALVGTRVFSSDRGTKISDIEVGQLGFAKRVSSNDRVTKVIEGNQDKSRVESKLLAYNNEIDTLISESEQRDVRNRIGFLNNKAAIISVGYSTELELREKGDRVEDAICATKAAIEEGYVPGGGTALLRAASQISLKDIPDDLVDPVSVILQACRRPVSQIVQNAGLESGDIIANILKDKSNSFGYNAAVNKYMDLFDAGVIDPKKVTRTAIENAASIALLLINTGAIVSEKKDDPSSWQPPAGWRPPEEGKLSHKY